MIETTSASAEQTPLRPEESGAALIVHFVVQPNAVELSEKGLNATALFTFAAPGPYQATVETQPLDRALTNEIVAPFILAFLPSGLTDAYPRINALQDWVAQHATPVELLLQGDRVLWTPHRAFILGAPDRKDDLIKAIISFTFFDSMLRHLERDVLALLAGVADDSHLTHQVSRKDLRKWPHVNNQTRRLWDFRACFAAITPALEHVPPELGLGGQARRLYAELIVVGELADRLEAVDDRLEVLEDMYESANDRLSEYKYFAREYLLEAIIIAVLAVDLALSVIDLFFLHN